MTLFKKVLQISVVTVLISALLSCGKYYDKPTQDIDSVHFKSATELASSIQRGEITSTELLNLYLDRIQRYNNDINAVVAMNVDAGAIIFGKTNVPYHALDIQSYNEIYGTTNNPWDLSRTPGGSSGGSAAALAAGLTPLELGSDLGGSVRFPAHYTGVFGHKPTFGIVPRYGHIPPMPDRVPQHIMPKVPLFVVGPLARSADDLEMALKVLTATKGQIGGNP